MKRSHVLAVVIMAAFLATSSPAQDLEGILVEAREAMSAGNYDTARQKLEQILQQNNTYAPAYFELSKVVLIQDDLKGAQENIAAAIENDPRNEEYRAQAETIAELSSIMSDAKRTYDERDYLGAVSRYEKALENHPTFASAYYGMGMAFAQAGQLREAAESFRQAQQHNPNEESYASALRKIVVDQYNEGNRFYRSRDWESAAEAYQMAIDLDSSFHQAYYRLARVNRLMGDNEAALETLDRVLVVKPDYLNAYVEKGAILKREDRLAEAEASYRQAITVDPRSDDAWVGLGSILRQGRASEAITAFQTAIEINRKNGDAAEYLGEIFSEQENWPEARKYLESAVKIKSDDHVTAWRLAHVYNEIGEYELARRQAKRSTDLKKTFEYGWYEKGIAEKALGNRVAAIEAFRNAEKGRDASIRRTAQYELKQLESPNR
ncbi:MAG: tetratricopeptide repeat protein [Fidelibacterota bacterium]|nr:MAG: tetratricopeptide repeat protein [Candidatus Neomarinimicrobiota bacterium]